MLCSKCGGDSKVVNSRPVDGKRVRMRRCKNCKKYFYTLETEVPYETGEMFMEKYGKILRESRKIKDE